MKIVVALIAVFGISGLIIYSVGKYDAGAESLKTERIVQPEATPAKNRQPVLIELFTSEGCSSCPPADKNLIYLNDEQPLAEAKIIALAMHVDYWNSLGWTDIFSAPEYSKRQESYAKTFKLGGVYTPQMIVDGESQFAGGSLDEAEKAVAAAAALPKGDVGLSVTENKLRVKISGLPNHAFSNVFLAIAEDNLSTAVGNGENGGKTLRHTSVARELKTLGSITADENSFETETAFEIQPAWKKQNLKLVVFVQIEQNGQIIGVNQIRL